jgi:hypothetical protein
VAGLVVFAVVFLVIFFLLKKSSKKNAPPPQPSQPEYQGMAQNGEQQYMNNAPPAAIGQVPAYQQNQYYPPQQNVQGGGDWKSPVVVTADAPWKPTDQYGNSREVSAIPHPHPGAQEVMGSPVTSPVELSAHSR